MSPRTKSSKKIFLIPRSYNPNDWKDTILDDKIYTYEDYKKLPEGAPYQLIGGNLIMTPAPVIYHQKISRKIMLKLSEFIDKSNLGEILYSPVDVIFKNTDVYQPDIVFVSDKNKKIVNNKNIKGAPDLVIEILSPSTAYYDLRKKYFVYEEAGVKEYWIVDPELKKIEVFENKEKKFHLNNEAQNKGIINSIILKGLKISLKDIF